MIVNARKVVAILLCCAPFLLSQEKPQKCWIYFHDKDETVLRTLSKNQSQTDIGNAVGISPRALARRAKVLPVSQIISIEDLPVSQQYIDRLTGIGISIANTSRWFNAVTAVLTAGQQSAVASLPFVDRVEAVRTFKRRDLPSPQVPLLEKSASPSVQQLHNYGPSFTQLEQIKVVEVHNLRITGRGVLVGMLDDGFRWKVHEATRNMIVLKEYDFVQKDSVTSNQPEKAPSDVQLQDQHGTITLSTIGGHFEGKLVGPAFGAHFILAKTEIYPTETNIEEDNWVAGIEWEEQNGVDVVSSSLGYSEFDATDSNGVAQHSYIYKDMNGRTATTSKAAVLAARRGVVVCSAMGNEGNTSWHFLTSPADADSIISVGAVNSAGTVASFSSVGPTYDLRTKPDVVADGVAVHAADTDVTSLPGADNLYGNFSGTSLSTPLVGGAAALILSAHPELTPIQVRNALRNTASNPATPSDSSGWGVINTYNALLYHGMVLSTDPEVLPGGGGGTSVGVFVVSNSQVKKDSVKLYYSIDGGLTFAQTVMTLTDLVDSSKNSGKYVGLIPSQASSVDVKFYVSAVDSTLTRRTTPYGAPSNLFAVSSELTRVPELTAPSSFALYQNFPNPFNPTTSIQYALEQPNFTTLKVYDVLGREVATLVSEYQSAGVRAPVRFDGSHLASGVYIYRLKSGEFSAVRKLVLLK